MDAIADALPCEKAFPDIRVVNEVWDCKRTNFLPVILTIVRQSWNEFIRNPLYPGIVTLMLGVWVNNLK